MKLRDYQDECLQRIESAQVDGINKQVVVLATGAGKTVIFGSLIHRLLAKTNRQGLVLAHREELLDQAEEKIRRINPFIRTAIEQGERRADDQAQVIIASVPTLGRSSSARIERFNPLNFSIVVVDEAHHASGDTYKNILRHFGLLKSENDNDWNKDCLLLGVTATPNRNDNKGIDQIFDKTTYNFTIIDGMKRGYLSKIRAFRIDTGTDLTEVKKTAGDFNQGQLASAVNNTDRNGLIVKTYKDMIPGKQALCFAVDVEHTKELTREFLRQGVNASFVVGETPKEKRQERLDNFYHQKINVMVNAMVLTEGYDNESIQAVMMARPTQSGILFQQMVGRGTRLHENKQFLTVLDFVDNTYKQNLQTTASLIGIPGALNFKGKDILETKEEVDQLLELAPTADLSNIDIDNIKYEIEQVDLLSGLKIPDEISGFTQFDWHRYDEGEYRVGLGDGRYVVARRTLTDQYDVSFYLYDKETRTSESSEVGTYESLQGALYQADKYIVKNFSEVLSLVSDTARWRTQSPSQAQLDLLKKLHVSPTVISQLNKGQASRLITKLLNRTRKKKSVAV